MVQNRILGTVKQSSGGGGLGKLLGGLAGAIGGAIIGGPGGLVAGAAKGAGIGSTVGGMAGGMINPAEQKNLGMGQPTEAAIQPPSVGGGGAIDRLNKLMDIGQGAFGISEGYDDLKKLRADAIKRRMEV